jgi:hypothetical protein
MQSIILIPASRTQAQIKSHSTQRVHKKGITHLSAQSLLSIPNPQSFTYKIINCSQLTSMRFLTISLAALATCASTILAEDVKIEVTRAVECERKTQKGDKISVHYKGTLASDGSEFDASYKRGTPLSFVVGKGQVIKG